MPLPQPILIDPPSFLCSDQHFYHGNIRVYEDWRQEWCVGTHQMNLAMIEAWNATVRKDDSVLDLGDFALGKREAVAKILRRLNGKVSIVRGNHDSTKKSLLWAGFVLAEMAVEFEYAGLRFICRHSPHTFSAVDCARADVLVHGHLHGTRNYSMSVDGVSTKAIDIGVDAIRSIRPISMGDLVEMVADDPRFDYT